MRGATDCSKQKRRAGQLIGEPAYGHLLNPLTTAGETGCLSTEDESRGIGARRRCEICHSSHRRKLMMAVFRGNGQQTSIVTFGKQVVDLTVVTIMPQRRRSLVACRDHR